MSNRFDPTLRVVEERGCYTPAASLEPDFFPELPDLIGQPNWELSVNAGLTWSLYPPISIDEPTGAAFGDVRYRNTFSIPVGYSGTFDVTISGDLHDATDTVDPGHIFYDGVDQGPIAPLDGPYTLTFPATPGFHVYEFRHGTTGASPGQISPVVAADYTNTVAPSGSFPVQILQVTNADGSAQSVRYFDALGNQIIPQPGDVVELGDCGDQCCPLVFGNGCYDDGSQSGQWTAIRHPDGEIILIDPVSGATIDPGDVIDCPIEKVLRTQHFNATPGNNWTPAAATGVITSLSYTIVSGTATVTDADGTIVATLPAPLSVTWGNNGEQEILPPQVIVADPGSRVYVHWTELT